MTFDVDIPVMLTVSGMQTQVSLLVYADFDIDHEAWEPQDYDIAWYAFTGITKQLQLGTFPHTENSLKKAVQQWWDQNQDWLFEELQEQSLRIEDQEPDVSEYTEWQDFDPYC